MDSCGASETFEEDEYYSFYVPQSISFRFRTRQVHATAVQNDSYHPNVLRLKVQPSSLQAAFQFLIQHCPDSIRSWALAVLPEWNIPPNLILKRYKDGWDEEFETEKDTYNYLKSLQGSIIPKYWGELDFRQRRAILLSDVGGACIATPEGAILREQDLRPLLLQALGALADKQLMHDDIKLDNFQLVGKSPARAVMVLDLELVTKYPPDKDLSIGVGYNVDHLMSNYHDHLECMEGDGCRLPFEDV